jgi:hypothetical protein
LSRGFHYKVFPILINLDLESYLYFFSISLFKYAIGISSSCLVVLELLATANDLLIVLLTFKNFIKILKMPNSFKRTVNVTIHLKEKGKRQI